MGSFLTPQWQALDSNGDVVNGALLNFFISGTTTPQDTFSDEALTSANANPVVADGAGRFGRIYLDPGKVYKIRLTDSAAVQIWEEDNVKGARMPTIQFRSR